MFGITTLNQSALPLLPLRKGSNSVTNKRAKPLAFLGPAFIASVAYVDPGNFAANINSAAHCGYSLLWILLWGNLIALLVQTLSCRIGIFTGASLAQNCGRHFPTAIKIPLWLCSEVMAIATDLAEVLGAGIGISLVFSSEIFPSCVLAGALSFLPFFKKVNEQRFIEKLMFGVIVLVGSAFFYEVAICHPHWRAVVTGTVMPELHNSELLIAASMLGATVMPHVVFLHSGLMRSNPGVDKDVQYKEAIKDNCVALNFAWLINAAMVVLFAAAFQHGVPPTSDVSIETASQYLTPLFGRAASIVFGVALIIAGLGSTTVGSMSGQLILDGFFNIKIPTWSKRALTLLPCLAIIYSVTDTTKLLLFSQAALSLALPCTIVPLIWLNSSSKIMHERRLRGVMFAAAIISALLIIGLNISLLANLILGH